jgi:photosystem II stability/assembly factor-like uncharacterized protein
MADTSSIRPHASLRWRCVGPFRGGRASTVCGDPRDPRVFYFGAGGGGLWKTTDAGVTWENVTDGFLRTASVGAIAVAPSDSNVVYVGMGECSIRGNVSYGDGVYRSTDAGATWQHLGLADTQRIARVRVHPRDENLVYAAALGDIYGGSSARGLYRSRDGGRTWDKILYKDENTGCIDLDMDPNNPRILFAAMWQVRRTEWSLTSGGPGSGLWKSMDGGDTWTEITRNAGLPAGLIGRIGIAISPARPGRVWALVEAEQGGLHRSDDGGATWTRVNEDRSLRTRHFYYTNIYADPQNADTMYAVNAPFVKSIDGGKTFTTLSTPHGDHHDLWIDPKNPQRMILACDGGGTVTFNGGWSWSSIYNQPTAEFYHVTTDTRFPYRIYGAQQDNTTICVPSRSHQPAITEREWYPVGGGESAMIAVRPDNPDIAFAGSDGGGQGGRLTRYDHRLHQLRDVSPWPERTAGMSAAEYTHRFQWTSPVLISPHDPNVLYMCGNRVFRSTNEGHSWEIVSPDLTKADPETLKPSGGPLTLDQTGVEVYATIFAFAESPVQKGLLWAGSDDGLVHVSRDNGATWENVTPKALPEWSRIGTIEPSPFEAGTAYLAASRHRLADMRPYLLKTTDFGKTWTEIAAGIPVGEYTRVVRADPVRRGLLFCGTELGIYASFDDGASWESLRGNLPVVAIHDLVVKDGDIVVATHGRSFWVCDGAAALLRQSAPGAAPHLFQPAPAFRFGLGGRMFFGRDFAMERPVVAMMMGDTMHYLKKKPENGESGEYLDAGQNPPSGVVLHYYLPTKPEAAITLTIRDSKGEVVRTLSSQPAEGEPKLPAEPGMNRFVWNMRYPDATKLEGPSAGTIPGFGPAAVPGEYTAELAVADTRSIQRFQILKDPRISASQADLEAQFALLRQIRDKVSQVNEGVNRIRAMRKQTDEWVQRAKGDAELGKRAEELKRRLGEVEDELAMADFKGGQDFIARAPRLNDKMAYLATVVGMADFAPTQQSHEAYAAVAAEIDKSLDRLEGVVAQDLRAFTSYVREAGLSPVTPA